VTLLDPKEITELTRLEQRLLARFSPPLPPEHVRRCLRDVTARFETAAVRTYLGVLIERAAVDELRATVRDRDVGGEAESSVAYRRERRDGRIV
jgi:hypothetical protein